MIKIQSSIVMVTPIRTHFTYPIYGDRTELKELEVDGIVIEQYSVDQPEMDEVTILEVEDGKVVGDYPYLKVVPVSCQVERLPKNDIWLKRTTHLPML